MDKIRKATDILLDLEVKVDQMMNLYRTLSFDVKVLSNKLNLIVQSKLPNNIEESLPQNKGKDFVEIKQEDTLPMEISPTGMRRTSRQTESKPQPNIIVPKVQQKQSNSSGSLITVVQRIVDKNGKSIFMANVEMINVKNTDVQCKARTNASGKWEAQVPVGEYKVSIKKREAVTQTAIDVEQTVYVDGSEDILQLDMLIIK